MAYQNPYNLMDESLFPRDSIYLSKENPNIPITEQIPRVLKTDAEIIAAVAEDMAGTLGAELEP